MNGQIDSIRILEFLVMGIAFAFGLWKAWVNLSNKVNGFGKRVSKVEENCVSNAKDIDTMKQELDHGRNERIEIRTMAAKAEAAAVALSREVADDRLAVMSTLHSNEKAAADRAAELKEKIGRLDERLNMLNLIRLVAREAVDELKESQKK